MRIYKIAVLIVIFIVAISNLYAKEAKNTTTVMIAGSYKAPKSLQAKNTIILRGSTEGEFVEVVIKGTIRNFEFTKIEWDTKKNDLVEKETIRKYNILKDKTIVIKTYRPEGIPFERIKWQSISGQKYLYNIHEDGKDNSKRYKEFVLK
jgi:hypothetical protein